MDLESDLGDTEMEWGGNLFLKILDGSSPGAACVELAQVGADCFMELHHPPCSGEGSLLSGGLQVPHAHNPSRVARVAMGTLGTPSVPCKSNESRCCNPKSQCYKGVSLHESLHL